MTKRNIEVLKDGKGCAAPYESSRALTPDEARDLARRLVRAAGSVDAVAKREQPTPREAFVNEPPATPRPTEPPPPDSP